MENTKILLDIQRQIGDLQSELMHVKDTGDKTLEQAKRTNGRVNKLENETIPKIEDDISCTNKKTSIIQSLGEKPIRALGVVALLMLLTKMMPSFTIIELIGWIKTLAIFA